MSWTVQKTLHAESFAVSCSNSLLAPGIRCIITIECTEARALGATPSRYTTQKVGGLGAAVVQTVLFCCFAWYTDQRADLLGQL